MGVEVLTDLGGRLRTVGNRARVLEESLFAFAATVSEIPITEQGLRGLSQIAKELAEDLDGHSQGIRPAVGRAKLGVISNDAHWQVESSPSAGYPERVGQCWRLAKGSHVALRRRRCTRRRGAGRDLSHAARRQRPAGYTARTRLRPQRSDLGSSRVSRPYPLVAAASPHRRRPNEHRRAADPDATVAGLEALVTDRAGWNPQHAAGYAERVGQWCLEKGSRAVVCDIYMHPLGGELRCEVDCEMCGTRASRSLDRFCSMRAARRKAFEAKGWTASGHRGVSLIGSTKSGPQRKSNESHQPTDPAESPRYRSTQEPKTSNAPTRYSSQLMRSVFTVSVQAS